MILMTHQQLFHLLDELRVVHVIKPEAGRLILTIAGEDGPQTLTVTDLKTRYVTGLKDLEEQRLEIEENRFAPPLDGILPLGSNRVVPVQFVKRDDQLTEGEQERKRNLLQDVDAQMAFHRLVIGGMNHLQVHFKELASRLSMRESTPDAMMRRGEKIVWSKGIKTAALQCMKELQKAAGSGKTLQDICREFLALYTIEGDEEYTVEQLSRNVQQIMQLDRAD